MTHSQIVSPIDQEEEGVSWVRNIAPRLTLTFVCVLFRGGESNCGSLFGNMPFSDTSPTNDIRGAFFKKKMTVVVTRTTHPYSSSLDLPAPPIINALPVCTCCTVLAPRFFLTKKHTLGSGGKWGDSQSSRRRRRREREGDNSKARDITNKTTDRCPC